MLSFRNSLTHPSLSSIISRQLPCLVDHSFKMYEMFLLIQPFLPGPPQPHNAQARPSALSLDSCSGFLPASLRAASPHFCLPHMSKVRQHLLKHTASRWNFLIQNTQWVNRSEYQAGITLYHQGETGHDTIQPGYWEKHHESIGCTLTLGST